MASVFAFESLLQASFFIVGPEHYFHKCKGIVENTERGFKRFPDNFFF